MHIDGGYCSPEPDMRVGQWVYCRELDEEFKIQAIKDVFLQKNEVVWVPKDRCEEIPTSECGYCHEQKPNAKQERYSAGCYAGRMCNDCAYSRYRDHCGVDGTPQLTQADVCEDIEPDDWGFGI